MQHINNTQNAAQQNEQQQQFIQIRNDIITNNQYYTECKKYIIIKFKVSHFAMNLDYTCEITQFDI